jgi:hypothetical protein
MVESNGLYRSGILIQSEATGTSTMAQYRVGRVPFAAVLEALAAHVNDVVGFLQSIVAAQRIATALAKVSLDEVGPAAAGGMGAAAMPGAGAALTGAGSAAGPAAGSDRGASDSGGGADMSRT